jgi:hypothetical protein
MKRKHQQQRQRDLFDAVQPIHALPNRESLRLLLSCLLNEILTIPLVRSEGAHDDEDLA